MKKSMKMALIGLLTVGAVMVGMAQVISGGGSVNQVTDEQRADGFTKAGVVYWRGQFTMALSQTNKVQGYFTLQPKVGRWGITRLNIGDIEIPIDPGHPLWQIPAPKEKVTNFWLRMDGYSSAGQPLRGGYFHSEKMTPGTDIVVQVQLMYVNVSLQYAFSGGHNAGNTIIRSTDGMYEGWYDTTSGAFVVSFDPLISPTEFVLIDTRNNSVFQTLPFPKGGGGNPADSNYGLSMDLAGSLETVLQKEDWQSTFQGIELSQTVNRSKDGTLTPARFVLVQASKDDYIQVRASGLRQGSVLEVWGVDGDRGVVFLNKAVVDNSLGWGWTVGLSDNTGSSAYKIVVWGQAIDPIAKVDLYLYRSDYPWGDGGLGRPVESPTATPVPTVPMLP